MRFTLLFLMVFVSIGLNCCKKKKDKEAESRPPSADKLFAEGYDAMMKEDLKLAQTKYTKACELKHGDACHELGKVIILVVSDVKKSMPLANKYFEKSCALFSAKGCKSLALHMELGIGTKANKARALKLYKKVCELGVGRTKKRGCEKVKELSK